ncbi:MAG: Rubrerythrin [Clostridia bacterium]|nr:Rubrerythrin [Clostridia bacterium]
MDFMTSQTIENLARAFAGECQAYMRYLFYAEQAVKEKHNYITNVFNQIATNEKAHAKIFFNYIASHSGKPVDNVNINTGYPFKTGNTECNTLFSKKAEEEEHKVIYPTFAKIAKEEGFTDIEKAFTLTAAVEGGHAKIFESLNARLADNTLYTSSFPTVWRCSVCGYTHSADSPWNACPLCGYAQGYVEINVN